MPETEAIVETPQFDPSKATSSELKALAIKELTETFDPTPTQDVDIQPENEEPEEIEDEEESEEPEEVSTENGQARKDGRQKGYVIEIDLGDGSGVQKFFGKTRKEQVEGLAKAQENSTRKIREQQEEIKQLRAQKGKPADENVVVDPELDDDFMLSQEMMTAPTKAYEKMFVKQFGYTPEEAKTKLQRADAISEAQEIQDMAAQFTKATGYYATEDNNLKIDKYLQVHNLGTTVENLLTAFNELDSIGLMEHKDDKSEDVPEESKAGIRPTSTGRSQTSTTLRSGRTPQPPAKKEMSDKEIYALPLDELKKRATKYYTESSKGN